jgi:hypothetical protein
LKLQAKNLAAAGLQQAVASWMLSSIPAATSTLFVRPLYVRPRMLHWHLRCCGDLCNLHIKMAQQHTATKACNVLAAVKAMAMQLCCLAVTGLPYICACMLTDRTCMHIAAIATLGLRCLQACVKHGQLHELRAYACCTMTVALCMHGSRHCPRNATAEPYPCEVLLLHSTLLQALSTP